MKTSKRSKTIKTTKAKPSPTPEPGKSALPKVPPKKVEGVDFVASIIAFVGARGNEGSTYWEWWKWFSQKHGKGIEDALMEYRGTCTARWNEAMKVGILVPTMRTRSQRDSDLDWGGKRSKRGARVYILRQGASVLDWVNGDKRTPTKRPGEETVISAFRGLRRAWFEAQTEQARDKLLLKFVKETVAALNANPPEAKVA